jgi:shikimate dehydrogenase
LDKYAVIGNPVSHSKSPQIHASFAEQTGEALEYSALLAEIDKFRETAESFFVAGGKGANVTVPFKEEAFKLAASLTTQASKAGAVNTLSQDAEGRLCGHNTDGIGLVTDIKANHGGSLANKSILVLGAGGATRGILQPFLDENPASICIANRTVSKAEALAALYCEPRDSESENSHTGNISACGFDDLAGRQFDWVINATSASLQGEALPVPVGLVGEKTWCYDLMYANEPTAFCRWSQQAGAGKIMDGLGMLVEQAAESFLFWRGIRPQTRDVIDSLRSS